MEKNRMEAVVSWKKPSGYEKPIHYKPYSEYSHSKYKWLETLIIQRLCIRNHHLQSNSDKFGIDVLVLDNKGAVVGGLEIESHGKYWRSYPFPYDTVHFLGRKAKYINENNFYILTNVKNAVMIKMDKLLNYKPSNMTNTSVVEEPIYDVPIEECVEGWGNINIALNAYFNKEV